MGDNVGVGDFARGGGGRYRRGVFGCQAPAGRTIGAESVVVSSNLLPAGDFRERPCTGIAQAKWLIRLVLRVVKTLICCIRFLRWTVRNRST